MFCGFLFCLNTFPVLVQLYGVVSVEAVVDHCTSFVLVPKGGQLCGGFIVARDTIATAANCLFYEDKKRWAFIWEVYVLHGNFSTAYNWKARYQEKQQ